MHACKCRKSIVFKAVSHSQILSLKPTQQLNYFFCYMVINLKKIYLKNYIKKSLDLHCFFDSSK